MKKQLAFQVPPGVKDLLPLEASAKRQLEKKFADLFYSWGYEEIITPAFEYDSSLTIDAGEEVAQQLYRFFDRDGKILALRPDMTTPIARVVATRLSEEELPLRLCYLANVFRYEEPQAGRQREFYQAGVELIGDASPFADGEVIALAAKGLENIGLNNFKIVVGQIQLFNGLMEELNISEQAQKEAKAAIANKDLVALEELVAATDLSSKNQERLLKFPLVHGKEEVFAQAELFNVNAKTQKALKNLEQIFQVLKSYGVQENVFVDLGVLRGFDYYTGVVFEGFTTELGFPICGGGRYDNLLGKFGYPQPATGFAVGLERLLLALAKSKQELEKPIKYLVKGRDVSAVLAKAEELRNQGYAVQTELSNESIAHGDAYCQKKGYILVELP